MRIVCVSDTHGWHRDVVVPDGDLLVHAGDITRKGELDTVEDFDRWLGGLPHRHKVVICGNHDFCFQEQPSAARSSQTSSNFLNPGMLFAAMVLIGPAAMRFERMPFGPSSLAR